MATRRVRRAWAHRARPAHPRRAASIRPSRAAITTTSTSSAAAPIPSIGIAGREELIGDARFATNEDRNANEDFINEIITEWTKNHTKEEAMKIIGAAGVPAGAVHDTLELWNDESFVERGIMQTMKHPDGDWKCETWPVRFDGKPPELKPAPKLGQHTDEVMASWLKMGPGDVAKLKSEKIIGNS
jgi:crotonobetainyl-CoA:carnitine CoA-transferase CaiB-like acyl-CoA transferase